MNAILTITRSRQKRYSNFKRGLTSCVSWMKILYYCPEYHARHGGRTHARGFFGALKYLPSVSESFLVPKSNSHSDVQNAINKKPHRGKLWMFPRNLQRMVRFFRPRPDLTRILISELRAHGCDALIIRTGISQPTIRDIKKACPGTTICLEINSLIVEEVFPELPLRRILERWEAGRYNQADAIVVVSSYLKTSLEKYQICREKILVNQNGVNREAIDIAGLSGVREQYGIPKAAFVIGYIGGMETFRRLPEVIGYIADLRRAGNDDIYFLIIGDGKDMPAVQAAIEADQDVLEDAVRCFGWLEYSEVPRYLATFDLAIFPFTNAYCSPLKLFEYLGAGVPTIGPDTPAVREVFEDGVHLKLVKQDGSDFVSNVLALKNNPQLRTELADSGKQLVLNEYTWERNAEKVVEHIQSRRGR